MNVPYLQACFMPWASVEKEIKLGPVTFWPFSTQAMERVGDKATREHLGKCFRRYIDHQGRPVSTVTVCSHGTSDFRQLTPVEVAETRAAVDALIFSIICPATKVAVCANNESMGPPGAERYQLFVQNFRPGDDHVAVRAGSALSGGWKISDISFQQPWGLGGVFGLPNSELLGGFSNLFDTAFPVDARERLLRSLEWFRFAHTESDEVSGFSRIVMMATAFEIVLDVPIVQDKSGWIADEVASRCAAVESIQETRNNNKAPQTRPKIGWWAWDFYKLRNAIVHGDIVKPERLRYHAPGRDWLTQLIVADLVFWECVTRQLYVHGCIGDNVRKCAAEWDKTFPKEAAGSSEEQLARWFLGFDGVHQALGWLPELLKR